MVTKCRAMRSTYTKGISVLLVAWSSFVLWGCNRMDMEGGRNSRSQRSSREYVPLNNLRQRNVGRYYDEFVKNELDALIGVEAIMHRLFVLLQEQENKSSKWQAIVSAGKGLLLRNRFSGSVWTLSAIPILCYLSSLSPTCPLSDQNTEIDKALTDASGDLTVINFGYATRAFKEICHHGDNRWGYYYKDTRNIFSFINEKIFDPLVQEWYRACPSECLGRGRITAFICVPMLLIKLGELGANICRNGITNCIARGQRQIVADCLGPFSWIANKLKGEDCSSYYELWTRKDSIEDNCRRLKSLSQEPRFDEQLNKVTHDTTILIEQLKKRIASISDVEKESFKEVCWGLVGAEEQRGKSDSFRKIVRRILGEEGGIP